MALTLRFNLADVMAAGFNTAQRRALTPAISSNAIKTQFARRAIDAIVDRTLSGKDKRDKGFTRYSKVYKQSRAFKIAGKSSRVNLKLSGEMQASIHPSRRSTNTVSISITDPEQEQKARGHINGAGSLPVRDFWGLKMSDQVKILKDIFKTANAKEKFEQLEEGLEDGEDT